MMLEAFGKGILVVLTKAEDVGRARATTYFVVNPALLPQTRKAVPKVPIAVLPVEGVVQPADGRHIVAVR